MQTLLWLKCRTALKALFLYFDLYPSVKLDIISCSFTSIALLSNSELIFSLTHNKIDIYIKAAKYILIQILSFCYLTWPIGPSGILPSLCVCRMYKFHVSILFSWTTEPNGTKLDRNASQMVLNFMYFSSTIWKLNLASSG